MKVKYFVRCRRCGFTAERPGEVPIETLPGLGGWKDYSPQIVAPIHRCSTKEIGMMILMGWDLLGEDEHDKT